MILSRQGSQTLEGYLMRIQRAEEIRLCQKLWVVLLTGLSINGRDLVQKPDALLFVRIKNLLQWQVLGIRTNLNRFANCAIGPMFKGFWETNGNL